MTARPALIAILMLLGIQESDPKPLTPEQREKQLSGRTSPGLLEHGSFDSFASAAYAMSDVNLTCENQEIAKIRLSNPFPEFYEPTWREVLETIARQTQTSWAYSEKQATWMFKKPALPLPFKVKLAKGWTQEDRGFYVFCKPPKAPVGMDIYLLGTYSFEKDADQGLMRARDSWAMQFVKDFNPTAKIEDMKKVDIDGGEALHFETKAQKPKVTWRQWVVARNGGVYGIVSALDDDQPALLKDVKDMVASFKFVSEKKDEKKSK